MRGASSAEALPLWRSRLFSGPGSASALSYLSIALGGAVPLPGGLCGEAGHAPRALVLRAAAGVGGRGVPDDARAARGALLEDVVVLQPVRPQGLLPHEDEDLHPPRVAELEGVDVVEAHGAVRRQAREVHPRVGQSGLPSRGAASEAGHLGVEEGARAACGP